MPWTQNNMMAPDDQHAYEDDNLAECGACGRNKPVCCDEGYSEDPETGIVTHVGAVCVDCCRPHHKGGSVWHGKSVAGGTYERCE